MKLIIAGGRDYKFSEIDWGRLNELRQAHPITEVVSGGATGADSAGEIWAHSCNIPVKVFKANWVLHGKSAGPRRNAEMAEYADAVVLFPGGRGTDSMFSEATKAGLVIWDFRKQPYRTPSVLSPNSIVNLSNN